MYADDLGLAALQPPGLYVCMYLQHDLSDPRTYSDGTGAVDAGMQKFQMAA
jgi:hypothetical protein